MKKKEQQFQKLSKAYEERNEQLIETESEIKMLNEIFKEAKNYEKKIIDEKISY